MLGFLIFLFILLILFYNFYWKRRNLPPGPTPLPLIGNILTIGRQKDPYEVFLRWKNEYGPIYTYWLGEKPIVAVSDFGLMKETFVKDGDSYTGRNFFTEIQKIFRGGKMTGIGGTDGELWKTHRRFMLHVFRNFGMGKNIIEDTIMKEVERLLDYCDQNSTQAEKQETPMNEIIEVCVGSIVNKILLGYRFIGDTTKEFYYLINMVAESTKDLLHPIVMFMGFNWPEFWGKLPGFKPMYEANMYRLGQIMDFFGRQIKENQEVFESVEDLEQATNYVQAYLSEKKRREETGEAGDFSINQLRGMMFDLWTAGQDTTTTTLKFAVLYIMVHEKVQTKMHQEMDTLIGNDRRILLADRSRLHYTNAVIHEIQRFCNLLPVNLYHKTTREVVINGYHIKEDITIEPQLCTVLYDEKIFPNPESFTPERFIDENGKFKKAEEVIPFSLGKRQCAGESLARDELFLFTSNLVHEFKISPSKLQKPPSLKKINGFFVKPEPYMVELERRIPKID